jgi:hypothetical protein
MIELCGLSLQFVAAKLSEGQAPVVAFGLPRDREGDRVLDGRVVFARVVGMRSVRKISPHSRGERSQMHNGVGFLVVLPAEAYATRGLQNIILQEAVGVAASNV